MNFVSFLNVLCLKLGLPITEFIICWRIALGDMIANIVAKIDYSTDMQADLFLQVQSGTHLDYLTAIFNIILEFFTKNGKLGSEKSLFMKQILIIGFTISDIKSCLTTIELHSLRLIVFCQINDENMIGLLIKQNLVLLRSQT